MLYSMTGFGSSTASTQSKKINVDIKSLNSKQLDMNCRVPFGLRALEPEIRRNIGSVLERGKVDVTLSLENIGTTVSSRLNPDVIKAYKEQIEHAAEIASIPVPTDWFQVLLRMPDVISTTDDFSSSVPEDQTMIRAVLEAVTRATTALMEYRRAEGVKLEQFFAVRIERIRQLLSEVPRYELERIQRIRNRITESLSKLPAVEYDNGRLEQEMIYYIEKLDVNEEKQRLSQHLDYFIETMNRPAPGQGKKLGFIAQEMAREINTLGSKSNHAEMQNLVVRMKDELEQIKEQVLNVM